MTSTENKGYASLMEAYQHNLNNGWRTKDELDKKLKWIIDRADKYAALCRTTREKVLEAWEAKRDYWWLNYYQDCNQPDPERMKGTPVMLYADWLKRGTELYGPDMLDWRLKCPACGHVQTLREFKEGEVDEDKAFTCCASRYGLGGSKTCKWTTSGLLRIGGVYVIRPDFVPVLAFAFADDEPVKGRIKVGDAVRIYHEVNQPERRLGEVKEVMPEGSVRVVFADIDITNGKTAIETRLVSPELVAVDREATEKLKTGGGVIID